MNWKNKLLTRREALKMLGIGTGAWLAPALFGGCAIDPVTGRQELMLLSPDQEIALDRQQSPFQFSSDYGPVQDESLNTYLNDVGSRIAALSHRPDMPFSFRAVNASYINAYAFPGGSIAATRGILVELSDEAELAALLGHEIGHVNARHTAEQATKGALANILIAGAAAAAGSSGAGLIQDIGSIGAGALLAHYSRDNEREADALGMEYMTRAGYSPEGMVGLMEILLKNGRHNPSAIEMMFSTHPMSEERLQTSMQSSREKYAKFLDSPDYRDRYLDQTAKLRKIKDAITAMQNGQRAMQQEKYSSAEEEFYRALHKAPGDYAALLMLAKCKMAQDMDRVAAEYAAQATEVYPGEAQAHALLGILSLVNRKYDVAFAQLSEYDRLLPGNPEIGFYQGLAQEGMGRIKEAARYYYTYLQQVRQGKQARYAYNRLKTWGYIK